ncbi:MAG: peptidoglycan DD-metalloendopeptidase family protein [Bacillota bacterium]|jgi:murein DD-endopeptidase MepM/ murein hydrolase activator NlpD|nr:M23 family metallopeptidase [Clostridia bacterium]
MEKILKKYVPLLILTTIMSMTLMNLFHESAKAAMSHRIEHRAKPGETVKSISSHYGLDAELVAAMNNINPGASLKLGQRVFLPREPEMAYSLQRGDTLWDIAQRYRVNVNLLIAYNNISQPNRMQVGTKIYIPVQADEDEKVVLALAMARPQLASRGEEEFFLPVSGVISSHYGWRKGAFHHGTDIAADTGTPIRAAKAGQISFVGWRPIYGQTIMIEHGQDLKTVYAHASKILVKKGQQVRKGQIIGEVGSTGRSTGPHLHFEVHVKGKTVNPIRYLSGL